MGLLIDIKHRLFDKYGIGSELYRPLIYWLFLLNPLKSTGEVSFPTLADMKGLVEQISGVDVHDYFLDRCELEGFMADNIHEYFYYFSTGYGKVFVAKAAEHFVSMRLGHFTGVFIDIAASVSPFYRIVEKKFPGTKVRRQDLVYSRGIHGDQIGGSAGNLPLEDDSVDLVTLHNSIEHFEGDADTEFIVESGRVLKKGGEAIILPVFLQDQHVNYVNPAVNPKGLQLDKFARIIYTCKCDQPRFMRHYSPMTLAKRILEPAQERFKIDLFKILKSKDFQEDIELALALKLTKL